VTRFLGNQPMGMSQKASAREIGVDQGTLARWERGAERASAMFDAITPVLADEPKSANACAPGWVRSKNRLEGER
jgi:hypothetical protein